MLPGFSGAKLAMYAFAGIFCAVGLGILWGAFNNYQDGETTNALMMVVAGLVFGGFGLGVLVLTVTGSRRQAREEALRTSHPDEPWTWRDDWAAGRIRSTEKSAALFFWGFAILWCLMSTPLVIFLPGEIIENGNYAALIGFLFPLVGVGLLAVAVRKTIQRRKYGDCVFLMTRVPGLLGGEVTGTILIPRGLGNAESINVRLSCIRRERRGSGKNESTYDNVLWQTDQTTVHLSPAMDGSVQGAAVRFSLPYDGSPSGEIDDRTTVIWKLEAGTEVPGVDFATSFEVPVYKTAASSPEITEERLRSEEVTAASHGFVSDQHPSVSIVPSARGGTEFVLKQRSKKSGIVAGIVIFLIFAGIAGITIAAGAPFIFPLVFGGFGVVIVLLLVFGAFGESRIVVEEGHVSVRNTLFGFMTGKRFPCSSIEKIGVKGEGQAGKGGYYSVTLTQADGRTLSPLQFLNDRREAEWLAEEVRKAMEPFRGK